MKVIRRWLSAFDSILAALVSRSNDVISLIPLSQPSVSLVSPTMALRTQISNILAISEEEIMPPSAIVKLATVIYILLEAVTMIASSVGINLVVPPN